ncbi:MAG: hypothetical protein ACFFD2_23730 [Promethearchaeota archaeon]
MNKDKSLETALRKINSIFSKQDINQITIQRKYLPEIFSADLIEISKTDGFPLIKSSVITFFKAKNILSTFDPNEAQFTINYDNLIKLKQKQVKTLKHSLFLKDKKIRSLEKAIIRELITPSSNKDSIKGMDQKIISLQKEIEVLKKELTKKDNELKKLEAENKKLRKL